MFLAFFSNSCQLQIALRELRSPACGICHFLHLCLIKSSSKFYLTQSALLANCVWRINYV